MTQVENIASENATVKSGWRLPLPLKIAAIALFLWICLPVFAFLGYTWVTNRSYTHGFLVLGFSGYLLWKNRERLNDAVDQPAARGWLLSIGLLVAAVLLRLIGIATGIRWFEGLSLLPLLMLMATMIWGRPAVRWATPALLFLFFLIPLPDFVGNLLNAILHALTTLVGTFTLQTLGIPAVSEQNVIFLTNSQIDVTQGSCGLFAFFALTAGACMIFKRIRAEKIIIAICTVPIAIAASTFGLIAAGVADLYLDPATADLIFVKVAPWFMLPLGAIMLWGLYAILNRLFVRNEY